MDESTSTTKRSPWSLPSMIVCGLAGCHLLSTAPPAPQFAWEDLDTLVLVATPQNLELTNSHLQQEIRKVCQSAKWKSTAIPSTHRGNTLQCLTNRGDRLTLQWIHSEQLIAHLPDGTCESAVLDEVQARRLSTIIQWRLCRDALDRLLDTPADGEAAEHEPDIVELQQYVVPTYVSNVPDGVQHQLHIDDAADMAWITESGGFAGRHTFHGPWKTSNIRVKTLLQRILSQSGNELNLPNDSS